MKNTTFQNLPEEKQVAVIQACLDEFIESGYKNASTNKMVRKLRISKGSLFQYFGSKTALYYYLLKMAADHLIRDAERSLTDLPDDLMERMTKVLEIVLNLHCDHPGYFRLFLTLSEKRVFPVQEKLVLEYSGDFYRLIAKLFTGIRTDTLQFGLERSVELFKWVLNGWVTELALQDDRIESGTQFRDKHLEKIMSMIELLKNGISGPGTGRAA